MPAPNGFMVPRPPWQSLLPLGRPVLLLLLGVVLLPPAAHGQADTTDTPPAAGTTQGAPADTTEPSDLRPLPFAGSLYGRPQTDSMPGRLPHVSVETILADHAGGFLYDLGEYGWPNGWSPRGLAPHRVHLWLDGFSLNDPLTGRPRFELLPPSFLTVPRTGTDPGGQAVGVHTSWLPYEPKRPITNLRYRYGGDGGLHAIEVGHSQKRRIDLFGRPGVLQAVLGFGGRKADGVYDGSRLRRERRIWARLRYQTNDWTVELSDRSSIYRIGAHGRATPPGERFSTIYALPVAGESVQRPDARRKTVRNDLTARVRAPLLPGLNRRTELAARWTSHTFDVRDGGRDTTWTSKLNEGHMRLRQSFSVGAHTLTGTARGHLRSIAQTNVQPLDDDRRGALHLGVRDSLRLGQSDFVLDVGGHLTAEQSYPSLNVRAQRSMGPVQLTASGTVTGQQGSWIEDEGFPPFVQPLSADRSGIADHLVEGTLKARIAAGPFDVGIQGFAHQIRSAVDLFAVEPDNPSPPTTITDTVAARALSSPVQRAGITLTGGWRRDARRGLYATGRGTLLQTLNAGSSSLHDRLAQTLPSAFGRARLGARFVIFTDLITDLYVQARGWSAMNSRWFHPPTGRLVVPPRQNPIPGPNAPPEVGPSGTIDIRAEAQLRNATLFFTFENVQAGTQLQTGTFVVPVYPLPPQQFRFGVSWPIFD
jgi:hypothetical protein